jgi:hypothetical protein
MVPFKTILESCRIALFDKNRKGGDIDLATGHFQLTFMNLTNVHKRWRDAHSPFDQFTDRATNRILRKLGPKINVHMVDPSSDHVVRVNTQEELEEAIKAGFSFRPVELWEIKNPYSEITLEDLGYTNLIPTGVPRPLTDFLGSPWSKEVTNDQTRLIMRHIWRRIYPAGMTQPYIEGLPYVSLNKKAIARLVKLGPPRFVNELFYAFYNESRKTQWWPLLRDLRSHFSNPGSTDILAHFVARCYEDAIGFDRFEKVWKTDTVMQLISVIRKDEDFGVMPILADALEDAGCDNGHLLHHLRNSMAEYTLGGWLFRVTGRLSA